MNPLTLPAPAKLNLFLHITGRRPDGYHELQTLFRLLDWGDTLHFTANDSDRVDIEMNGLQVPLADNLVFRAAEALRPAGAGLSVIVEKRIPAGGGLGGGSSNAATTLLAANRLWSLGRSREELAELGRRLGADVPVFVHGASAWAEGVGEKLTPIELPDAWYVVIHPGCSVPTARIFSDRQLTRDTPTITIPAFFAGGSRNDCEPVVRRMYPPVHEALCWLAEHAPEPRLTGTGACIFAEFNGETEARRVADAVPPRWQAIVARGRDRSPASALAEVG